MTVALSRQDYNINIEYFLVKMVLLTLFLNYYIVYYVKSALVKKKRTDKNMKKLNYDGKNLM